MPITYQYLTDRTLAPQSAITLNGLIHIVDPNDVTQNPDGSSYKAELSQLVSIFGSSGDTFVTGGTYSAGTATFTNNTGGTFNVTGFFTGSTDVFLTGGTYSAGTTTFTNNTGGTFNVTGFTLTSSGGTNINTVTSGSNTVINLNNNINLTGVTATTISATTYQNLPGSTSANCITELFVGKIRPCTSVIQVVGNTVLSGKTPTALKVVSSGSSTSEPIMDVSGSTGDLFSIKDSLTGNLFSVNNISGLPTIEVYDNYKMLVGNYSAPAMYTTVKFLPNTGVTDVFSIEISGYTGAWFDYTVVNGITPSARAGQIMAIFSANTVNYVESVTTSIGTTTDIGLILSANSTNCILQSSATTLGWEVKTIIRTI
jgi:hypothetical protein